MPITPPSSHWAAVTSCLDSTQRQIFNVVKFKGIHKYGWKYEYYGGKDPQQTRLENSTSGLYITVLMEGEMSNPRHNHRGGFLSRAFLSSPCDPRSRPSRSRGNFHKNWPSKQSWRLKKCVSNSYAPVLQQFFLWSKTKFDLKTLTFLKEARWKSMNLAIDVQYSTSKWIPSKGLPTLSKLLKVLPKNSRKSSRNTQKIPPQKNPQAQVSEEDFSVSVCSTGWTLEDRLQ